MAQAPPPRLYRSKKSIYLCYVTNDDDAIERRDLQMIYVLKGVGRDDEMSDAVHIHLNFFPSCTSNSTVVYVVKTHIIP